MAGSRTLLIIISLTFFVGVWCKKCLLINEFGDYRFEECEHGCCQEGKDRQCCESAIHVTHLIIIVVLSVVIPISLVVVCLIVSCCFCHRMATSRRSNIQQDNLNNRQQQHQGFATTGSSMPFGPMTNAPGMGHPPEPAPLTLPSYSMAMRDTNATGSGHQPANPLANSTPLTNLSGEMAFSSSKMLRA